MRRKKTHTFPFTLFADWIYSTIQGVHWVVSLGCETNVSNVPDPNQESDSGTGVAGGYTRPLWMNRQGTVNLEDQEPEPVCLSCCFYK